MTEGTTGGERRRGAGGRAVLAASATAFLAAGLDAALAEQRNLAIALTCVQAVIVAGALLAPGPVRVADRRSRARLPSLALAVVVSLALLEKAHLALDPARAAGSPAYRTLSITIAVMTSLALVVRSSGARAVIASLADHPARLALASFGAATCLGAFLLSLPHALLRPDEASFLDALFTATSAVCVTGLTVGDVSATYTPFGQAVLLLLIQAGGLGIMVLSSALAVLAGRRLRVRESAVLVAMMDADSLAALRRDLVGIVAWTLGVEALGAAVLYGLTTASPEVALGPEHAHPLAGAGGRGWWSVFHAVSAFCNAGFSLSHDGLSGLVTTPGPAIAIMMLVLVGGLGYPVAREVALRGADHARGRRPPRWSLHTRVVAGASALLFVAPAIGMLILEGDRALAHLGWGDRVVAALFQSASMRTAGFHTIATATLSAPTLFLACGVMIAGASPGSTGGGIKTTTLAVLWAALRAELRGRPRAELLDRRLAAGTVRRALGVSLLALGCVLGPSFTLLVVEGGAPFACVFEVVSAFTTCGLSTGLTAEAGPAGRLVLVVAMFVGRIGPLTAAVALAGERPRPPIELPEERVMIG